MYCPKCGTQNPENAGVCLSCSQPLPVLSQTAVKTSALAIWSFVLAMIGLFTFMITALPALICGIVGLVKIGKSGGRLKGTGLAVAGIVLPVVSVFILPFLIGMLAAIMMPALAQARMVAQKTVCASNLKGLGAAMMVYTKNNNNTYPSTDNWCGLLVTNCNVTPKQFCCPSNDVKTGQSSYAININIAGKKVSEVPPDTVLLFEAKAGVNPAGGPELLTTENHQPEGCNILFADAHVEFVKKENLSTLRWTTE